MKRKNKRKIKIIKDNYGWFIALSTFGGVIILNLLKFIEYLKSNLYFAYYGIDINLYEFEDKNVLYDLGLSILLFLITYSVLYCLWQTCNKIKNKIKLNSNDFINVILIIIYNITFIIKYNDNINFNTFCFQFLILLIMEFFNSILISKLISSNMENEKQSKEKMINYLKILPFCILLLLISLSIVLLSPIIDNKNYRIINDKKVIVYTSNDYYLTLDCEIIDDELIIYKGTQEKINNTNIYSVYREFEKIEFK